MKDPNKNLNNEFKPDAESEIDLASIRKASGNARFYNQVILWVVIFIIIFGAGCGAYLYYFITSSEKRSEETPAQTVKQEKIPSAKPSEKREAGTKPPSVEKSPETVPAKKNVSDRPPEKTPAAALKSRTPQPAPKNIRPKEPVIAVPSTEGVKLAATDEVSLPATREVALASTSEISTSKTSEASLKAPEKPSQATTEVAADVKTSENAILSPAPPTSENSVSSAPAQTNYASADTVEVQKLITSGKLTDAMNSAAEKLKIAGLDPDIADLLRIMRSKISLFAENNFKEAHADFSKIKNPKIAPAEYASIFVRLFGYSAAERSRQLISGLLSDTKIELQDEEKIELAKSALGAGLIKEATRILNNVIAVADFKSEIEPIKKIIALEESTASSPDNLKYKNTVYTLERTGALGGKKVVSIKNSEFFNARSAVKGLFSSVNSPGTIFARDSADVMHEIDSITGRLLASYPLAADKKISFAGCFEIFGFSQIGMVKSGEKYQFAPIRNSAFKKGFEPPYIGKADLPIPMAISPSGKHAIKLFPSAKKTGECSMEVVSLLNGKSTAKSSDCLFRENDFSFIAFSTEMKKYSVDSVLESKYLFYFKSNPEPPGTSPAEFRNQYSLCMMNLETGDEKSLLNIRTNNPSALFISNLYPSDLMALSFEGSAANPGFAHLSGGTWISGRNFETATYLSQAVFRSFAASISPGKSKLTIFAAELARPGVRMYEIEARPLSEAAEYAKFIGRKNPRNSLKMLKMFEEKEVILTPQEKGLLSNEIKKFESEYEKNEAVRTLLELRTLQRMKLEKTALDRAETYIKPRREGDADLSEILEIKAELEKTLSNVK